jgi:hypothetical protein
MTLALVRETTLTQVLFICRASFLRLTASLH